VDIYVDGLGQKEEGGLFPPEAAYAADAALRPLNRQTLQSLTYVGCAGKAHHGAQCAATRLLCINACAYNAVAALLVVAATLLMNDVDEQPDPLRVCELGYSVPEIENVTFALTEAVEHRANLS